MRRPPRHPEQPILTGLLMFRTVLVGLMLAACAFALFEWELLHGESIEKARTAAVHVFAVGQAFYLLNCRSLTHSMFKVGLFSNLWVWAGITAMMLAQVAFIYTPTMNWLFHTQPLGYQEWLLTLAGGAVVYLVIGIEKFIRVRLATGDRKPSEFSGHKDEESELLAYRVPLALSRRALSHSRWALGLAVFAVLLSIALVAFECLK